MSWQGTVRSYHGVQGNTSSLRVLRYGLRFPCPEKEHEAPAVTLTALYNPLGLAIATEEWCWFWSQVQLAPSPDDRLARENRQSVLHARKPQPMSNAGKRADGAKD